MLIVADILPQTSEVVPIISVYFLSILIEVSCMKKKTVLLLSVFRLYCHTVMTPRSCSFEVKELKGAEFILYLSGS